MPRYDYRCTTCGTELELTHSMRETVERHPHSTAEGHACEGALERLISAVGLARSVGQKAPTDDRLQRTGFTKYVRGSSGYEKAFGSADAPDFIHRE